MPSYLNQHSASSALAVGAGGDPARKGAMYTRSISGLSTQRIGEVHEAPTPSWGRIIMRSGRGWTIANNVIGGRVRISRPLNLTELGQALV